MQLLLNCLFFSTRSHLVDTLSSAPSRQTLRWCKKRSRFTQAAQSGHTRGPMNARSLEFTLDFTVEIRQSCPIIKRKNKQSDVCAAVLTTDFPEFVASFLHNFSLKNRFMQKKKKRVTQHHDFKGKQDSGRWALRVLHHHLPAGFGTVCYVACGKLHLCLTP